jgi:hypothetical protein
MTLELFALSGWLLAALLGVALVILPRNNVRLGAVCESLAQQRDEATDFLTTARRSERERCALLCERREAAGLAAEIRAMGDFDAEGVA